jgi:hypothetical protein
MTQASEDGNHDALVDPRLGSEYNDNEMARMIACAAACVRHSSRRRPRMGQVCNQNHFRHHCKFIALVSCLDGSKNLQSVVKSCPVTM